MPDVQKKEQNPETNYARRMTESSETILLGMNLGNKTGRTLKDGHQFASQMTSKRIKDDVVQKSLLARVLKR